MKLSKKTAACVMSVLLCLGSLTSGAGMETEVEVPDSVSEDAGAVAKLPAEETGTGEEAIISSPDGGDPCGKDRGDTTSPVAEDAGGRMGEGTSGERGKEAEPSGGMGEEAEPSDGTGKEADLTGGKEKEENLPGEEKSGNLSGGMKKHAAGVDTDGTPDAETEAETESYVKIPGPDALILAGPVELNTKGLFLDEDAGEGENMEKDAIPAEDETGSDSSPAAEDADAREDGVTQTDETENSLAENAGAPAVESTEVESEGKGILQQYRYEDSLTLRELSLLPQEVAGAATELAPAKKRMSRREEGMFRASSEDAWFWTCSDYYVNEKDLHHVSKKEDFSLKYQIEFHTSTDLDEGSVEIRVPEELLKNRQASGITPYQIGVPAGTVQAPCESLNSPFNWYRDDADGSLVFFNYRPISSGTNTAFQVLYHPVRIVELTDGSEWSLTPEISVTLQNGSVQGYPMQTLTGIIDSMARLLSSSADAFSDGTISCMPALYTKDQVQRVLGGALPSYLSAQEGEWLYIAWQIDCQGQFNQPWEMRMDADLSESGIIGNGDSFVVGSITRMAGTAEGISTGGSIVKRSVPAEPGSVITQLTSQDLSRYVSQGLFHLVTTVVTAVRKDCLQDNRSVLNMDAELVLTPADALDGESRRTASASWRFVDYEWKYKGNDVGIFAWTGSTDSDGSVSYNNRSISLSGWVNEYRLSQETGKEAGTIPFRIRSECRGYAYTHETEGSSAGSYRSGTGYEVTTADDVVYLVCQSQDTDLGMQMLTSQDYYYSSVRISIKDRGMDIYEDKACAPMDDAQCPGADRSTKIWAMYEDSEDYELAAQLPWNSSGKISYTFSSQQLSRKVWRVKVVHCAADYDSTCTIDTRLCIRPESPVCGRILPQEEGGSLIALTAEHLGSVLARSTGSSSGEWFHDSSSAQYEDCEPGLAQLTNSLYGMYAMRANSFASLTSLKKHARALKTVSRENDPANGCIRLTCTIGALEGYLIYSREAAARIAKGAEGLPCPDRREYVIYDLLPEGVIPDPSVPVKAGLIMEDSDHALAAASLWDSRNVSARIDPQTGVVSDWKHTGRTMVILHVTIGLDGELIPRMGGGMWMNGVGVQFGAVCPYRDLKRMKAMPNIAAVMPGDMPGDPAEQILGTEDEVSCDDGNVIPYTGDEKKQLEAFGADIDSDGVTGLRTVLYAIADTQSDTAVSLTDGINLTVKADSSTFTDWEKSAVVGAQDPYTYRIDVTNTSAQPITELVITGHLEIADEERPAAESGRVFDDETWKGSLTLVDTDAARRQGIAPVIWLNRDRHAPLPGEGHPPDSVLTAGNGWIRLEDWEGEMNEALSFAVELRKKTDGTGFELEMGDSVQIFLHMDAPGIGDGEGQTRAEHAYHCVSFYSISQDEPDGDLVQGNAVEVTLKAKSALIVEKALAGGSPEAAAGEAFLFRLIRSGEPEGLCRYRLENRVPGSSGQDVWSDDGNLHTTGRDGLFSLTAGQRAVFEDEAGADDLEAQEIRSACYEVSMQETTAPEGRICRFENTWYPPLYLTKKVLGMPEGASLPSDVFRVRVTAGGSSLSGMPYWTVDPVNGLVENQVIQEHVIDADSCVLLHADEVIALHPGDAQCSYEIIEEGSCFGEGTDYEGVTTEKNGILAEEGSSVTLENAWRWKELRLRKEVLHRDLSLCGETFSFRLWKLKDGTDLVSSDPADLPEMADPVSGVPGTMEGESFVTDADGCFSLPCAGKEVVLEHLEALHTYVVQEINAPADYEMMNGGCVFVTMPLLGSGKNAVLQNSWKKRSLEVSKAVLSGVRKNRTTVFTPGYPGPVLTTASSQELFSFGSSDMTGFTVTFPRTVRLIGDERIRVVSGGRDIDAFAGTIAAGTSRTYTGYSQVSLYLWNLTERNKKGFFFCLSPQLSAQQQGGEDDREKTFSFLLELADGSGVMRASPDTPYRRSDGQELFTDENGCFTLSGGMSALFTDLADHGTKWRVTETPDPSCPQAYPAEGRPQEGVLGDGGEDTAHALFINGQDCQGMIRKMYTAAPGDAEAAAYLESSRTEGDASLLRTVLLIEKMEGGTYVPLTGPVSVADASDGSLLRCEIVNGTICLSEDQTILLSGFAEGTALRITEQKGGMIKGENLIYEMVCTVPGREGQASCTLSDEMADVLFVNELHSVSSSQESLVRKEFLQESSGFRIVPEGAVLALCLERYEGGSWHPEAGADWVQCLDGNPVGEMHQTGDDGIIRVKAEASSGSGSSASTRILPIAISHGNVRTLLYYLDHEAQEGDLRIREVPDLSDPSFGMMTGCEGNTFLNENDMQTLVVEKRTDTESDQSFTMRIVQMIGSASLPAGYLSYTIRSSESGEVTGSGKTDAQGCFSLRGGMQAVFSLPQGTVWEVSEKSSGSWRLMSCTMENSTFDPVRTDRGMQFEVAAVKQNVTLTQQLLDCVLTDPATGQVLDFTLQDITIPHYVRKGKEILEITRIDDGLFSGSDVRSVTIGHGIREIGEEAFFFCMDLEEIILPDTLEQLGAACFGFTSIERLEIPSCVKEAGEEIVTGCDFLEEIIIHQKQEESIFSDYDWDVDTDINVVFTG